MPQAHEIAIIDNKQLRLRYTKHTYVHTQLRVKEKNEWLSINGGPMELPKQVHCAERRRRQSPSKQQVVGVIQEDKLIVIKNVQAH